MHLIMDCYGADKEKMNNPEFFRQILLELPEKINMKRISEPDIKKGAPHLPGVSGLVMIETSHVSIHSFTGLDYIAIDVFSCKTFEPKEVLEYFKEKFGIKNIKETIIERDMHKVIKKTIVA